MKNADKNESSDQVLLELTRIVKDFPGTRALDSVSLDVRAGEIHGLVGENGAGKSTLLSIIGGIYTDFGGTMELQGKRVRLSGPPDADRLGIRVIHQELTLVPPMTVAQNIMLGQEPRGKLGIGVDQAQVGKRAEQILAELGFELPLDEPVENLGIGKQQLVEIAHAFARDMRVLVLDEPTATLSQSDVARLFEVLRSLRDRGMALIYISHRLAELPQIADRITILRDGKVVGTYAMSEISMADVSRLMIGRDLQDAFPARKPPGEDVLLSVRHLDLPERLEDICFDVHAGEILGISGLLGAGRTELFQCLYGAAPGRGEVRLSGEIVRIRSPRDALRLGIALIPEDRRGEGLVLCRPVSENLALPMLPQLGRMGLVGRHQLRVFSDALIEQFAVKPTDSHIQAGNLSGGNQQKVVIGKSVGTNPRVFLFDEPTRGIDVGTKTEIYRLIGELSAAGHAVLIVSSELPELIGLAHRILVMYAGRMVAEVPAAHATENRLLRLGAGQECA